MVRSKHDLVNLRELLEAHLQPEAGPHSIEICALTGLRAVEIAENLQRERDLVVNRERRRAYRIGLWLGRIIFGRLR